MLAIPSGSRSDPAPPDVASTSALRVYWSVIRRHRVIVLATIALCVLFAAIVSFARTPMYRSAASIQFQKLNDVPTSVTGQTYVSTLDVARELETAANLMGSQEMAARTATSLGLDGPSALDAQVTAEAVEDTNVVRITAISSDPDAAARAATGYAEAFTTWKRETQQANLAAAEKWIQTKMKEYSPAERTNNPTFGALNYQLQGVRLARAMSTGNYSVAERGIVPSAPFKPRHLRDVALGLVLGLLLGVAAAFVADALDITVRTQEDISAALTLPIIGRLPAISKAAQRADSVEVLDNPSGLSAEAFRMLRGNLEFMSIDNQIKSILVTSCVAGEGKTSSACNLAVTLGRSGKRVVLVEADLRRPRITRYFGIRAHAGLTEVLRGKATLEEALHVVELPEADTGEANGGSHVGSVSVLASGELPPNPGEIVLSRSIGTIIAELSESADIVLVDSPPFLVVGDAAALASHVDGAIVVMRLGHVTRPMLRDATAILASLPCKVLGVAITNANGEGRARYEYGYYRSSASADDATAASPAAPNLKVSETS
jgi:capsular exopolysaccharide synthesis family protein